LTGAAIGGIIGGILLFIVSSILLLIVLIFFIKRLQKSNAYLGDAGADNDELSKG